MRLIAKKPCSFGGRTFYIGEEIPTEFVLNPKAQEKLGVIAIVACGGEVGMKQEDMVAQVGELFHNAVCCHRVSIFRTRSHVLQGTLHPV